MVKLENSCINLAIVAHVDHGKTTMVDALLRQGGVFRGNEEVVDRVMDSNTIEKERGITIFSKVAKIAFEGIDINIIDTPGHSDFGVEVERILSMVDGVILLVDANEGVMPQTKFVLMKAVEAKLKIVVVLNKIDREGADTERTINGIEELVLNYGTEDHLDYPVLYASGRDGWCVKNLDDEKKDLKPLFKEIINYIKPQKYDHEAPFTMLASLLDSDLYLGKVIIGKVYSGTASVGQKLKALTLTGENREEFKVSKFFRFKGIKRVEAESVHAGDIVCVCGMKNTAISDTICDVVVEEALDSIPLTPPIISIGIGVSDSPLAGRDGSKVTSRVIKQRLDKEAEGNVGIVVSDSPNSAKDFYEVKGRGELQLSILVENMRREGFEFSISKPEVIIKKNKTTGETLEPIEEAVIDLEEQYSGSVMEELGLRKGEILEMLPSGEGRIRIIALVPARCLVGYHSKFLTDTKGTGIMNRIFHGYEKFRGEYKPRKNGSLISMNSGKATGYSIFNLQDRGVMFVSPGDQVYEGMVVGEHNRENDLEVNITKAKQLTNMRASGTDEAIKLIPPKKVNVVEFLSYINDTELIEVTKNEIRLRKKILSSGDRKKNKN